MDDTARIAANLREIRARIAAAAREVDRNPDDVTLVAVAKTHPAEAVAAALAAGQTVFGENRVQEAQAKYPALQRAHPALRLHLIGPLQTNKVKDAVALFDAIETVDREKLARALAGEMQRQNRRPQLFVQVNIGEEPQKAGIAPREADAFIALCRDALGLSVAGLMCIPPADRQPAPYFALLREIAQRNALAGLSMGMSGDYESAIRLGATLVRVGTAIFGTREAPAG
ncbi:YggS family pyridoxal phosphate-dependent enzyme [Dongia sedimenti]|uniref:Pyridoxal phosphate homeostasis protein n=1 Tax=Dongia sedimenti TaxID=3064282 RepID=A0ABU0YN25_9PROT|nr:YggS family pyridoxal phosphate-dependent enzyme [Rhodospirillaceae bacterium R-7]